MFSLKLCAEMFYKKSIKIFSSQMCITRCGFNFKDAIFNTQYRYIKCSSAHIKNQNILLSIFNINTISNRCCGRFVNNSQYIQPSNFTCIFCCLSLRIIKVSRDSNYSISNFVANISFSNLFHMTENHC